MKICFKLVLALLFIGCAASKKGNNQAIGNTRTEPLLSLNDNAYLITTFANDTTYAYTTKNAVKVGGFSPQNERRFLNGLAGPNGEVLKYYRTGSCCSFKTPNGMIGNAGMLDIYKVFWDGAKDTLSIYINMYDEGNLRIPNGLTARTPKFN